uniref:Uncharacterized protein n=1 Tax=Pseudo-nitzschia australis TaxID=44445 RepID=A0A6V0CIE8_9STRA
MILHLLIVFLAASLSLLIVAVNSEQHAHDHSHLTIAADHVATNTDAIAVARAANERYYEHFRKSYLEAECAQFWGEFPSRTDVVAAFESHNYDSADNSDSTAAAAAAGTTTGTSTDIRKNTIRIPTRHQQKHRMIEGEVETETTQDNGTTTTTTDSGMPCTCGMLYDIGQSVIDEYIRESGFVAATATPSYENIHANSTASKSGTSQGTVSHLKCVDGFAGQFPCNNVDLVVHLPKENIRLPKTGLPTTNANDLWGWTSSSDSGSREFVVWGIAEGTFFVEIFNDDDSANLLFIWGYLPSTTGSELWRDVKVIGNHVYVGSEARNHGMQIFDMNQLLDIDPGSDCTPNSQYCKLLVPDAVYKGGDGFKLGRTHNIIANEESNYLYLVGGNNGCKGGLHVVDVSNPRQPRFVTCFGGDKYVHDAHCVNYKGPDANYYGKEICFCFNESRVTIVDVSNKSDIQIISRTYYKKNSYTHQGWLSTDHTHIVFGDELDEMRNTGSKTRTMILQVRDLANPTNLRYHFGETYSIDHDLYIIEATALGQDYDSNLYNGTDLVYQANYQAGLTVLQVVEYEDGNLVEVGSFQTFPNEITAPMLVGAWSSYPYFASGLVAISSIREGLFIVRPNLQDALIAPPQPPSNAPQPQPPSNPQSCGDSTTLDFKNKGRGCTWVEKTRAEWTDKRNRRRIRRKCSKLWNGERLSDYCPTVCGKVGKGKCKNLV